MIAIYNSDPQVRNLPVGLAPTEVADPYLVLHEFFSGSKYMPRYRKRLKKWFLAALNDKKKWKRDSLIRCIYCFEDIGRLLEALWLISKTGDLFSPEDFELRKDEEDGDLWTDDIFMQIASKRYDEMAFHPEFLTMEEEEEPYEVIRNYFKGQDLFEAKKDISFWCSTAVADHYEYVILDRKSLVHVYEQTCRIIEAAFIIVEVRNLKERAAKLSEQEK